MGVDISTYRCRIGSFRQGPGMDVVLLMVCVNYQGCMKMVGSVSFIVLLLLMAGIEANPGPLVPPTAGRDTQVTMYPLPDYFPAMSVRLSRVLDEIGLSRHIVMRRRNTYQRMETNLTLSLNLTGGRCSIYYFGSQSEGTTTVGLNSDVDALVCSPNVNVIQNWQEWEHGKMNLMMIQDETTAPGYCRLQLLRPDVPLPANDLPDHASYTYDRLNRVIMKNTHIHDVTMGNANNDIRDIRGPAITEKYTERHGPAHTLAGIIGYMDMDEVYAYKCKTFPNMAHPWLIKHRQSQWPSRAMLQFARNSGCFLVPVGHRQSEDECTEWRISPSLSERCLMYSMNITQIKCYVVLKLIMKSLIIPSVGESISSFHCKTVLFWCIESTTSAFWTENNLLSCIIHCLHILRLWVERGYCPQYFIPEETIFAGKVNVYKRHKLNKIIKELIFSQGRFLLKLKMDNIGERILLNCSLYPGYVLNIPDSHSLNFRIAGNLVLNEYRCCTDNLEGILNTVNASDNPFTQMRNIIRTILNTWVRHGNTIQQLVARHFTQFLSITFGSIVASLSINNGGEVLRNSLPWFACGIDSDVSSSRLKLASVLYCTGDMAGSARVLRDIEERFGVRPVINLCNCYTFLGHESLKYELFSENVLLDESVGRTSIALCVRFIRSEIYCAPPAMQHEMFRSIGDDVHYRGRIDYWMDLAVVDSLPYLYYLQYMTYRQLGRHEYQYRAKFDLIYCINNEPNLGHRETAMNLLGTIWQLEGNMNYAFDCYRCSLGIRPRNNAADWHMGQLLSQIVNAVQ